MDKKMTQIWNDKALRKRHAKGTGYIYNDFGDATGWNEREFNKLHKASCRWVKKMTTSTPKYFFETFSDAMDWLHSHRRNRFSLCKSCLKP